MARVFSDLRDGGGQRYFYSLETAPGGTNIGTGSIRTIGLAPTIFVQVEVSRTPAPAALTVNGLQLISDVSLRPAPAALSAVGQIPSELRQTIVTNTMPLDYAEPQSTAPTIAFIDTKTPQPGLLTINYPAVNVTQGGNIGFVQLDVGSLVMQGLAPTIILSQPAVGQITLSGLVPAIQTELIVTIGATEQGAEPSPALSISGLAPSTATPFQWIDVDAPPAVTWTTTTGIAA